MPTEHAKVATVAAVAETGMMKARDSGHHAVFASQGPAKGVGQEKLAQLCQKVALASPDPAPENKNSGPKNGNCRPPRGWGRQK